MVKDFLLNYFASLIIKAKKYSDKKELSNLKKLPNSFISDSFLMGEGSRFNINGPFGKIEIGNNVLTRNFCNFYLQDNARLIIGNNVFLNNNCSINCLERIDIGDNTIFGEGVKIYDHNHQYQFTPDLVVERNKFSTAPVCIGKNCWIGSNVTILKGVTIGDNVIVGANCLVYKSIPANTIVKSDSGFSVYTQ